MFKLCGCRIGRNILCIKHLKWIYLVFSQSDIMDFYSLGQETFSSQKQYIRNSLDKYLSPEGVLQISEVEKDWFPSIKADVFL